LETGFDESVMICPFFHTHHRPPHPVVHTTGSPSQKSAGLRGAQSGTGSPTAAQGGLGGVGGSAFAYGAPTRIPAANPQAAAMARTEPL
jgi:hypothetical protein